MNRVTTWLRNIQDPAASPNEDRHATSRDHSYPATLASCLVNTGTCQAATPPSRERHAFPSNPYR